MGFGNTVPPPKRDEHFLNSAVSSLYSVRARPVSTGPPRFPGPCACPSGCSPSPSSENVRAQTYQLLTLAANTHFTLTKRLSPREPLLRVEPRGYPVWGGPSATPQCCTVGQLVTTRFWWPR